MSTSGVTWPQRLSERLRESGALVWALVGMAVLLGLAVLLLMVLRPLALSLLTAVFIAVALVPLVDGLARRRVPRAVGATVALLVLIAVAAGAVLLVLWGIGSQRQQIDDHLSGGTARLDELLGSAGLDHDVASSAYQSAREAAGTVLRGLAPALGRLLGASIEVALAVFLVMFVCFFLLKDGHAMAAWWARWLPAPGHVSARLLARSATTIRRYFGGLTVLGALNAVAVAAGALVLRVPLVAAIAIVTLLASYVPYLGAPVAGAFAVVIAWGAGGTADALWMLVIVVLANTLLQYIATPFAFGAALQLSPLAVLLVTLVGGALAGVAGLTFAAPLVAVVLGAVRLLAAAPR